MGRPRVLVTPWRRKLKTALDRETDLLTIAPDYTESVRRAGGLPLVAAHVDGDEIEELLDIVDAVVLSGGHDMAPESYGHPNTSSVHSNPGSDAFDLAVTRSALQRGLPILGICRGAQVLNVALGGDLRQEVQAEGSNEHPTYAEMAPAPRLHRHDVNVTADCRLAAIYGEGTMKVNSLHHQAIGEIGEGLRVVATSPDGLIEAIEGVESDVVAVQWHPEMLAAESGGDLFADLLARATARLATLT